MCHINLKKMNICKFNNNINHNKNRNSKFNNNHNNYYHLRTLMKVLNLNQFIINYNSKDI